MKPQIIWIELSDEAKFAYVENMVSLNTVFFLTGEHVLHILGLLNSKLISWYFKKCIGTTSGVGTNRWLKYTIEHIPLVPYSDELETLVASRCSLNSAQLNTEIDALIAQLYGLSSEENMYINSLCV